MIELSNERIVQIMHVETARKESLDTILRSVYIRYMRLYEKYFADIDTLDDAKIAEFRDYHEETISLIKIYYMDIPLDICMGLIQFEKTYTSKLLGNDWYQYLYDLYENFKNKRENRNKSEEDIKAEFTKQCMKTFYDIMDYIFREGFGTGSETVKKVVGGISGLTDLLFR